MLPIRQAVIIALIMLLVGLTFSLERVGARRAPWLVNTGKCFTRFNLDGWAATCWLAAAQQFEKAAADSMRNNYEASRAALDAAADAYSQAASVFNDVHQTSQAVNCLNAALKCSPARNDLKTQLLTTQYQQGDAQALRTLTDLAYRHDIPQAQIALAQNAMVLKHTAEASSLLQHAAFKAQGNFEIQYAVSKMMLKLGDDAYALKAAQAAWASAKEEQQPVAYKLLKQVKCPAPWAGAFWGKYLINQFSLFILYVIPYLLIIFTPALRIMFNKSNH